VGILQSLWRNAATVSGGFSGGRAAREL
jgi:hypothetical protein